MSPNSDNAMARFLFAILKQKNLKDIDWNQVAQDPVLLQPITNGHAARMRYSRFRATVTGHEPQKRGRVDKDRVSKPKKEGGAKRGDVMIKSESGVSLSSLPQYSPSSLSSPYLGELGDEFGPRFLTPCSDDMQGMVHPAAVEGKHRGSNGFASLIDSDLFDGSLTNSPAFSAFDALDFSGCSDGTSQNISDISTTQSLEWDDRFTDPQLF